MQRARGGEKELEERKVLEKKSGKWRSGQHGG